MSRRMNSIKYRNNFYLNLAFLLLLFLMPWESCAMSRQPYTSFSNGSTINSFAGMYNGFGLASSSVAMTFNSCFPVGNTIFLNGGTVSLSQDLFLDSGLIITTTGTFAGIIIGLYLRRMTKLLVCPILG